MTENKANANRLGYIGKTPNMQRDSDSWFTPKKYLDSAREAMPHGAIDLDPFAAPESNQNVQARNFISQDEDALTAEWPTVVSAWMNPPYSAKLCKHAIARWCEEYQKGTFSTGIVLVNNATETKWFFQLMGLASAVCFTNHRIAFENVDGKHRSGNTRGQVFLYFGQDIAKFATAFKKHGFITRISELEAE